MFVPSETPSLGFSFVRTVEIEGLDSHVEVDVFPHRLAPAPGVPLEDLILGALSYDFWPDRGMFFAPDRALQVDFDTPLGTVKRGAFVACVDDKPREARITVTSSEVIFPDGRRFDAKTFRPYYEMHPRLSSRQLDETHTLLQRAETPAVAIYLGAIEALLPVCAVSEVELGRLRVMAGRLARIADIGTVAGKMGMSQAVDVVDGLWRDLASSWICPPDRPYAPEKICGSAVFDTILAAADPEMRALGARLIAAVPQVDADLVRAISRDSDATENLSAHQQLRIKALRKRLAPDLEALMPLDLLKPAARKRQEKLRAS